MHPADILLIILLLAIGLFVSHWIVTFVHHIWVSIKYGRLPECDCPYPKWGMIGDVFVCDECTRHWSVWWDDFASGWGWMPYYKKIFLKFGWIAREHIREPVKPEPVEVIADSKARKVLEWLRRG